MIRSFFGLCGCEVVVEGSYVVSVDTCSWCMDLAMVNLQLAILARGTDLAVRFREGREASGAGAPSNIEKGRMPDPLQFAVPLEEEDNG